MTTNHKLVCARAARREFKEAYCRGIGDYRGARLSTAVLGNFLAEKLPDEVLLGPFAALHGADIAEFAWDGSITQPNREARNRRPPFRVMARKRPLQPEEIEAGTYDSISVEGANSSVIVHDGRVHRDGRTLYMVHSRFSLDRLFGEAATNAEVYEEAAQPLVQAALSGGRATLLMFGQTGTGKTYTAGGILHHLAQDIFSQAGRGASILIYELGGSRGGRGAVFDLLAERKQVKCLTGEDGQVHVRGAVSIRCDTPEEFHEAVRAALAWRSSECTERNEASSRSHAVVEIKLDPPQQEEASTLEAASTSGEADEAPATPVGGVLRVVDLAGSERNYETHSHTRQMAERGGQINFSLLMLKECARILHANKQRQLEGKPPQVPPFRSSRLTHLLRSCFVDESHKTVVIATLSPSPTDVEHTLNSLQHVGMMRFGRPMSDEEIRAATGESKLSNRTSGFGDVDGRGHALHSKLQDARKGQLKLHAFDMVTQVGGTIQKRYEPENVKMEAFIDPRWHREMNVEVEGNDLWVLKEADAEVVQLLTAWKEEQWEARKAHDISRWDANAVQAFVASLDLPGEAKLPSTMNGSMVKRLSRRAISSLCSDEATAEALHAALQGQKTANVEFLAVQKDKNSRMALLGHNKVQGAAPAPTVAAASSSSTKKDAAAEEAELDPTAAAVSDTPTPARA